MRTLDYPLGQSPSLAVTAATVQPSISEYFRRTTTAFLCPFCNCRIMERGKGCETVTATVAGQTTVPV